MRITCLLLLIVYLAPNPAFADMYRWVDKDGVVHYGDRLPPSTAKQRREVLNQRGQIVSIQEREATEEERAQAQAEKQERLAAEAVAADQAQYDLSLTATYTTVSQLDAAYENRLAIVDGKIRSAQKTHADIEKALEPLRARAIEQNAETGLDKRIKQTERRLQEQELVLERLQADRAVVNKRHQADRERFLTLTGE